MAEGAGHHVLVIASERELEPARRIWGTGGWLPPENRPPEDREALDWLTLARLMGWSVGIARRTEKGLEGDLYDGSHFVIIACDPDCLGDGEARLLAARLAAEPLLIVARAGAPDGALSRLAGMARSEGTVRGTELSWTQGEGADGYGNATRRVQSWHCRNVLEAGALEVSKEAAVWAMLDGAPVIAARQIGRGYIATLGFNPSAARDRTGAATALLKHLLIYGAQAPIAWLELAGTLVLRMDDPGGAQNVHCRSWHYPKLNEAEWSRVGEDLKRRDARLSICYTSGWVDDGDAARGRLDVAGKSAPRVPGRIHPSPLVRYEDCAGHTPGMLHDYEAEFRGIQHLRAAELGEVELHGYTHMHPDAARWAAAADRYESLAWYRELGRAATETLARWASAEHPLVQGIEAIQKHFGVRPTTLVCPGDDWTEEVIERALDLGLCFVNDYHLAIRDGGRFCWTSHVCAPYLSEPEEVWFDAGLPVIGYFHDRELALEGTAWMSDWLDAWQDAGAQRLIDFRELAAVVGRHLYLDEMNGELLLTVTKSEGVPPFVRPLAVNIRRPDGQLPRQVSVSLDGFGVALGVNSHDDGTGSVTLPSTRPATSRNLARRIL